MNIGYIIIALIIGYLIGGERLIREQDREDDDADDEL